MSGMNHKKNIEPFADGWFDAKAFKRRHNVIQKFFSSWNLTKFLNQKIYSREPPDVDFEDDIEDVIVQFGRKRKFRGTQLSLNDAFLNELSLLNDDEEDENDNI